MAIEKTVIIKVQDDDAQKRIDALTKDMTKLTGKLIS